jgi:hypothetical protein
MEEAPSGSFLSQLPGQAVRGVVLEDESLLRSLSDGHLRRALGTLRASHDFFNTTVVAAFG